MTKEIAFKLNKKGQRLAYEYSRVQMRWFRVGIEEANLLIATERAIKVEYHYLFPGRAIA